MEKCEEADYKELIEKTKLSSGWQVWENWEDENDKSDAAYLRNMQSIAKFDNWIDFWRIWHVLPHGTPAIYFGEYRSKEKI